MYVLKRTDQRGGYVAKPGSKNSYTRNPVKAQRFASLGEARANSCPENEVPVSLSRQLND